MAKHRAYITTLAGIACAIIILSGAFLFTRGSSPAVSELAFTERSLSAVGSVIPASCDSGGVYNGDGNYSGCTQCWDGSYLLVPTQTCPPQPTCANGALDYPTCTPPVSCSYSYYYTEDVYSTSCSGTTYGYHVYSCTDGTWPEYEVESNPFNNCATSCDAGFYWDAGTSSCLPLCTPPQTWNGSYCVDPAPTSCPVQDGPLNWDPGCSTYYSGTINNGETVTVYNTASGYDGYQTYSCNNGAWGFVSESCTANSCTNGATNPPTCNSCPAGQTFDGTSCVTDCTNGATNPPACDDNTCQDPAAENYGAIGACTYTPYPDLTAGSISPTSATAGNATTLSATISNIGNLSTGSSFNNFLQVATAANGGGTITDLAAVNMSTLASGASAATSKAYTFPSGGTYSTRACADKSSAGNGGTITESNEGNNCGVWTNITVTANPTITNVSVNYNDITFVCNNATSYTVTYNETGAIVASGSTTSGATVTAPHDLEGSYTLKCIQGALSAQAIVNYTIPALTYDGIFITASPRTVIKNKNTTVSWSILNPKSACNLRAEVVCSGGHASCTQAQLTQETSLNTQLQGTTDSNDPYGASRNIQTAVKTVAPENNPTGDKALGKKTLLMTYTTDLILDCGPTFIKKFRIITSDENEG